MNKKLLSIAKMIPCGSSSGKYGGIKYLINKMEFNNGRSMKLEAFEAGGKDYISFNLYITSKRILLKPCEMPAQKAIDFLENIRFE